MSTVPIPYPVFLLTAPLRGHGNIAQEKCITDRLTYASFGHDKLTRSENCAPYVLVSGVTRRGTESVTELRHGDTFHFHHLCVCVYLLH